MKARLIIWMLIIPAALCVAQWVPTPGPNGGWVLSLARNSAGLFAGTCQGGVFRSTNDGATWMPVGTGVTGNTAYAF